MLLCTVLLFSCSSKKNASNSTDVQKGTTSKTEQNDDKMKLGAFSISLNVKDIQASKDFYEKLGFTVLGGDLKMNYLIMKNGNAIIGLFQGMFEGNILTFNPGWDENGENFDPYTDVREIEKELKSKGIKLDSEVKPGTEGPGNIILKDPDGNTIFFDQHR